MAFVPSAYARGFSLVQRGEFDAGVDDLGFPGVAEVFSDFDELVEAGRHGSVRMRVEDGVVDSYGEVFNYPGLYIADGFQDLPVDKWGQTRDEWRARRG